MRDSNMHKSNIIKDIVTATALCDHTISLWALQLKKWYANPRIQCHVKLEVQYVAVITTAMNVVCKSCVKNRSRECIILPVIIARMNVSLGAWWRSTNSSRIKLEKYRSLTNLQSQQNYIQTDRSQACMYRESSTHRFILHKWNNFLAYESASTGIVNFL
jgi:hypothetical protein